MLRASAAALASRQSKTRRREVGVAWAVGETKAWEGVGADLESVGITASGRDGRGARTQMATTVCPAWLMLKSQKGSGF